MSEKFQERKEAFLRNIHIFMVDFHKSIKIYPVLASPVVLSDKADEFKLIVKYDEKTIIRLTFMHLQNAFNETGSLGLGIETRKDYFEWDKIPFEFVKPEYISAIWKQISDMVSLSYVYNTKSLFEQAMQDFFSPLCRFKWKESNMASMEIVEIPVENPHEIVFAKEKNLYKKPLEERKCMYEKLPGQTGKPKYVTIKEQVVNILEQFHPPKFVDEITARSAEQGGAARLTNSWLDPQRGYCCTIKIGFKNNFGIVLDYVKEVYNIKILGRHNQDSYAVADTETLSLSDVLDLIDAMAKAAPFKPE